MKISSNKRFAAFRREAVDKRPLLFCFLRPLCSASLCCRFFATQLTKTNYAMFSWDRIMFCRPFCLVSVIGVPVLSVYATGLRCTLVVFSGSWVIFKKLIERAQNWCHSIDFVRGLKLNSKVNALATFVKKRQKTIRQRLTEEKIQSDQKC